MSSPERIFNIIRSQECGIDNEILRQAQYSEAEIIVSSRIRAYLLKCYQRRALEK